MSNGNCGTVHVRPDITSGCSFWTLKLSISPLTWQPQGVFFHFDFPCHTVVVKQKTTSKKVAATSLGKKVTKWKTKWPVKICLIPGSSGDFPINSGEIDPEMKQNDIQGCVIKKAQNIRNGSPHIVGIRNAQLYADFAPFLQEPGSPHHSEPNTHTEDVCGRKQGARRLLKWVRWSK